MTLFLSKYAFMWVVIANSWGIQGTSYRCIKNIWIICFTQIAFHFWLVDLCLYFTILYRRRKIVLFWHVLNIVKNCFSGSRMNYWLIFRLWWNLFKIISWWSWKFCRFLLNLIDKRLFFWNIDRFRGQFFFGCIKFLEF